MLFCSHGFGGEAWRCAICGRWGKMDTTEKKNLYKRIDNIVNVIVALFVIQMIIVVFMSVVLWRVGYVT